MTTEPAWTITCSICGHEDTMPWDPHKMRRDVATLLDIELHEVMLFCRECWPSARSSTVDTITLINRAYRQKSRLA